MSASGPAPSGPTPLTRGQLLWFDLTQGGRVALGVLHRELGGWTLARLLLSLAWRSLRDPFHALPQPTSRRERLARHQVSSVLHLDEALRLGLGLTPERAQEVLLATVSASGARFLEAMLASRAEGLPGAEDWAGLAQPARRAVFGRLVARFFNMEAELVDLDAGGLSFEVSACHFARLTHALGRAELGPLFCAADSVFFDDPSAGIELKRPQTLAQGDAACCFHLRYRALSV